MAECGKREREILITGERGKEQRRACQNASTGSARSASPSSYAPCLPGAVAAARPVARARRPKDCCRSLRLGAAYLGPDGRLHAVSFDGKSDIAGPSLPHLGGNAYLNFASAGISPAGSVLADRRWAGYARSRRVTLVTRNENTFVAKLSWSQDLSMLAIGDNTGGFWTIKTASGHAMPCQGRLSREAMAWAVDRLDRC